MTGARSSRPEPHAGRYHRRLPRKRRVNSGRLRIEPAAAGPNPIGVSSGDFTRQRSERAAESVARNTADPPGILPTVRTANRQERIRHPSPSAPLTSSSASCRARPQCHRGARATTRGPQGPKARQGGAHRRPEVPGTMYEPERAHGLDSVLVPPLCHIPSAAPTSSWECVTGRSGRATPD